MKKNSWSDVIVTKEGLYLIYLEDYKIKKERKFDEVEELVYRDYIKDKHKQKVKKILKQFENAYELRVNE
jgi:parvulin-like peptidyl-prolyl isomerase